MAEQDKTTLPTPDLVDMNYKVALTIKVDELLKQCNVNKMETIKQKSIDRVVKDTGLRRNKTKPYHLDQRRKSPKKYKKKGFLQGTEGTLKENLTPGLDLIAMYHDEQHKLFNELSNRFPETLFLTNTKQEKDETGRWYLYRDGRKLTTAEFLNFIDKITLKYIEGLKVLDVKLLTSRSIEEKEHDLESIVNSCKTIVMARYLDNATSDNDFMKDEETKLWRNHVKVILSFAALLVILRMFKLKLRPKGKNQATNQANSQNNSQNNSENNSQNNSQNNSRKQIKNQKSEFVLQVFFGIFLIVYWFYYASAFVGKLLKKLNI